MHSYVIDLSRVCEIIVFVFWRTDLDSSDFDIEESFCLGELLLENRLDFSDTCSSEKVMMILTEYILTDSMNYINIWFTKKYCINKHMKIRFL